MQTVKEQIGAKLAELETLLEQATCDGQMLADIDDDVSEEINSAFSTLCEAVHYYVD